MKEIIGLYLLLAAIFFVNLINITLFGAQWNGIALWLNIALFITGTVYFLMCKNALKNNNNRRRR